MLRASDIMAAKVIVQLGYVPAEDVRAALRAVDRDPAALRDVVNRLTDAGRLQPKQIETVRHRVALYEHVRSEASYVRALERTKHVSKLIVAELIAGLEKTAFRKRLGDVLVRAGKLSKETDASLLAADREAMKRDDARVVERYRKEDFAGVAKGLIPGSKLDPSDFKISTLFRGKETRALIDKAELRAALAEEVGRAAPAPEAAPSPEAAPPPAPAPDAGAKAAPGPAAPVDRRTVEERVRDTKRIGEYAIVEVLGIGGMGAVFLAQRDGTGEYVAIKVILNEKTTAVERARFHREIELTPLVKHRNVIALLDSGKTPEGSSYLVVPALAGKELRALIDASPDGLAPDVIMTIFPQVLEGLKAIHEAGILHRDLKPENVFVLAGGQHEVRIMDFGLARRTKEDPDDAFRTNAGDIVGSPAYIAPETVQSDPIDERTDLYSVGIMLFEALTGKRPIEAQSTMGFLTAHMVAPPLTLAEARPERTWPAELEAYLASLLGKSRDERPANALAALERLEALRPAIVALGAPQAEKKGDPKSGVVTRSLLGRLESEAS